MWKLGLRWMAVAIFFLIHHTMVSSCPTNCNCNHGRMNCRNASLESVPNTNITSATIMDLSFNRLPVIRNENFLNMTHLRILFLNNNGIVKLEPHVFHETKDLTHLSLNDNKIPSFTMSDFSYMTKLRTLYLQNNVITYIDQNLFEKNIDLVILDISGNKIQTLAPDMFKNNVILSWVSIKNNPLTIPLEWQSLLNTSLNVLDVEFCSQSNSSLNTIQNIPGLHGIKPTQSFVSLEQFTSYTNGLYKNESLYLASNVFHYLFKQNYGSISSLKIAEDMNVLTMAGETILCYCGLHSYWFWCYNDDSTCSKTTTEKYKFLNCSAHVSGVIFSLDTGDGESDSRSFFWNRPITKEHVIRTLLYASIPGCIIIIVVVAHVFKVMKRRREKSEETSHFYSELVDMSSHR